MRGARAETGEAVAAEGKRAEPELEAHLELDFEEALQELEALVETLERGELSLEESLRHFERGVRLTRLCQEALRRAEQKVQLLTAQGPSGESSGGPGEEPGPVGPGEPEGPLP